MTAKPGESELELGFWDRIYYLCIFQFACLFLSPPESLKASFIIIYVLCVHKLKRIWVFWGKTSRWAVFKFPICTVTHLFITCSQPEVFLQSSIDLPTNSFFTFILNIYFIHFSIILNGEHNLPPLCFLMPDTILQYHNTAYCLCFVSTLPCINL